MTDIVKRLRADAHLSDTYALMNEAADEIERLYDKLMNLEYEYDRLYEELRIAKGNVVRCIEAPDYLDHHITVGREYVVNKVIMRNHGSEYLRILGDDNRGCDLLHSLFERREQGGRHGATR